MTVQCLTLADSWIGTHGLGGVIAVIVAALGALWDVHGAMTAGRGRHAFNTSLLQELAVLPLAIAAMVYGLMFSSRLMILLGLVSLVAQFVRVVAIHRKRSSTIDHH